MKKHLIFILFSIFFYFFSFFTSLQNSITSDEEPHIVAGYEYLKNKDFRWNPEHPPLLKELAAIPLLFLKIKEPHDIESYKKIEQWDYSYNFLFKYNKENYYKILNYSHLIMIFFGLLLGLFIYLWAIELYENILIVMVPLLLYFFDPNFLGHATLVTTDVGSVAFAFGGFYFLFKFYKKDSIKNAIASALFIGLALSSKHTIIMVLPIYFLILMIILILKYSIVEKFIFYFNDRKKFLFFAIFYCFFCVIFRYEKLYNINLIVFSLSVVLFFLHLILIFNKWNSKIRNFLIVYIFDSLTIFAIIVFTVSLFYFDFKSLLKLNFCVGFDNIKYVLDHAKSGHNIIFLNGKFSSKGFKEYYVHSFLVKTPILTLVMIIFGSLALLIKGDNDKKLLLLLPPILYLILISIFNKAQIGVRHIYFIYPFFYLVSGYIFYIKDFKELQLKLILLLIFLLNLFTIIKNFPEYISYTNGLLFPKDKSYLYINDSNIYWGQSRDALRNFIKERKIIKVIEYVLWDINYDNSLNNITKINTYEDMLKEILDDKNNKEKIILVLDPIKINITPKLYNFVKKYKPDNFIRYSLLVYDIKKLRNMVLKDDEILKDFYEYINNKK